MTAPHPGGRGVKLRETFITGYIIWYWMECDTATSARTVPETDSVDALVAAAYQFQHAQFPAYADFVVPYDIPGLRLYRSLTAPRSDRVVGYLQVSETHLIAGPLGSWPGLPDTIRAHPLVEDPTIDLNARLFVGGMLQGESAELRPTGRPPLDLVVENPVGRLTATYYPCGHVELGVKFDTPRDKDVEKSRALPARLPVPPMCRMTADEFNARWLAYCSDLVKQQWIQFDNALPSEMRRSA